MTITRVLENLSNETPVAVDIAPNPTTWAETSYREDDKFRTARSKIIGETSDYSYVRDWTVRKIRINHPDHGKEVWDGYAHRVTLHSTTLITDSVSGDPSWEPNRIIVEYAHGGANIDNPDDVIQAMLTALSEFWDSVTSSVPDTSIVAKTSLGVVRVD